MNNIAVILAGGKGTRYKSEIPKQFVKLNGKPIIYYVLDEFIKSNLFSKIVVALGEDTQYDYIFKLYSKVEIIHSFPRNNVVKDVIKLLENDKIDNVIFHDGVRPLIKSEDLSQYIENLKKYDIVVTAEKIVDSLSLYGSSRPIDRNKYRLIQTPEAFKYNTLKKQYCNKINTAFYNNILRKNKIGYIELNHSNLKLTYEDDLVALENLIKINKYIPNKPKLINKKILVLGGSGGVGTELIEKLKEMKAIVRYPTRKELELEYDDIKIEDLQWSDIIINVAGVAYTDENDLLKHYNEIMNVNFKFNMKILQSLLSLSNKNVVMLSSSSANKGRENLTIYSASKAALHSGVEALCNKLSKKNIFINVICPEKINTSLLSKLHGTSVNTNEVLKVSEVIDAIISYCDTKSYGQIVYLRKGKII